jgi:hypothetical protein
MRDPERPGQIRMAISLEGTTDLMETAKRLGHNNMSSVEKVELYVERSFRGGSTPEFLIFMEAIGSLPKMIALRIRASSFPQGSDSIDWAQLPFSALKNLMALTCRRSTPSLKYLHLCHVDWTMPNDLCPVQGLANLMEQNTHLKELRLHYGGNRKISVKSQQALVHMLQYKNFSLQALDFDCRTLRQIPVSRRKKMRFYLALNQTGLRQKLLDPTANPNTQDWEEAIISNREKFSMVFYLLSQNPAILCP